MSLLDEIQRIKSELTLGKFVNEAAISQGVVLPILNSLGWSIFDTHIVMPEFSVKGKRVDFALCNSPDHPVIFIEVKSVGNTDGAEEQLFEYAYHQGVPLLILTDGKEWSFYLPAEQGSYQDRIVYKLDLIERDINDSIQRLERYLSHTRIISGEALDSAREDYKDVTKKRQSEERLPEAWRAILEEPDELLILLLSDKVADLCGFKPDKDTCANFIKQFLQTIQPIQPIKHLRTKPKKELQNVNIDKIGFNLRGKFYPAHSAREVMTNLFKLLANQDSTFLERFASRKHGRTRRYIARSKMDLYSDRPDLSEEASVEIVSGWWLGTNYNRINIDKIIRLAAEVAGVNIGTELTYSLSAK